VVARYPYRSPGAYGYSPGVRRVAVQRTESAPKAAVSSPDYKTRFVIRFGEHLKSLAVADIAYCYSENKSTFARTYDGRVYPLDHNLDSLEEMLNPLDFFRINRQYIVMLKAIAEMKTYSKARVIIKLSPSAKEAPVVSSERAADFKRWLAGEL
jgi:DNA-binding LytR/AlgR family response regulator